MIQARQFVKFMSRENDKYCNVPFNYSGELNYSATPITFIQSSPFREGKASRLRDYPPISDKILPGRFFFASAPNLQFLSISYYSGKSLPSSFWFPEAGFLVAHVTFQSVGTLGVSLHSQVFISRLFSLSPLFLLISDEHIRDGICRCQRIGMIDVCLSDNKLVNLVSYFPISLSFFLSLIIKMLRDSFIRTPIHAYCYQLCVALLNIHNIAVLA